MDKLNQVKELFEKKINSVANEQELKEIRNQFISKNGSITALMQNIKELSIEEKKTYGAEVNKLKNFAEEKIFTLEKEFEEKKIKENLKKEALDITLPVREVEDAYLHPMTKVQYELQNIFVSMGFAIADGPEIEDDWHCFEALNMPPSHPARQMQDTFYMPDSNDGKEIVLRTQTTCIEVREMLKGKPPFKILTMGKTYRRDFDATHVPMFHQIEAFYVDMGITMANLKFLLMEFCKKFFEVENIVIGKAIYSNAKDEFERVWGNNIILAYVPKLNARTEYDPAFAYTIRKKDALQIDEYEKEGNKVRYIRATDIYTPFLVGAEAGYLISNVNGTKGGNGGN